MPLVTRRRFVLAMTTMFVTLALTIGSALAAELLGTIKSVDTDAKKITVTPKEGDDVVVTVKGLTNASPEPLTSMLIGLGLAFIPVYRKVRR